MGIGRHEADGANKLRRTVKARYSYIPQVVAIYCVPAMAGKMIFWIFTGETHFDRSLREVLLSEELLILDEFPELEFSIEYVPALFCDSHAEITGDNADLVFIN